MNNNQTSLSVIVPVYNESESLHESLRRLDALRQDLINEVETEIIFVDDGSKDGSLAILKDAAQYNSHIKVLSFSRNFGHQIAITAGLDFATGDYVAVIDADLQDPPELIKDMLHKAMTGVDVVYGKRRSRSGETWFKKATASLFYRLLSYLCDIEIPRDTGDFRLMTRRSVEALKTMREHHRFVRGMVPWMGFKQEALEYNRDKRFAGETKYPFKKMFLFATNAILSFSRKPLTLAIYLGIIAIICGALLGCYMFMMKLFWGHPIPGITAIIMSIIFFSGIQLVLIGVVGEYIARIFEEVKQRPLYFIAEKINAD